jgi:hypothetical protein
MRKLLNSEICKETPAKAGIGAANAAAARGAKPSPNASAKTKTAFSKNFTVSKSGSSVSLKSGASKKAKI